MTGTKRLAARWLAYASLLAVLLLPPAAYAAHFGARLATDLPDPCSAVSPTDVATAFAIAQAPTPKLSIVLNTETCTYSYKGVTLSVFVGLTSIGFPGTAKKVAKIPGLAHGMYATFTNTAQTQVNFFKGDAATGTYGIVRCSSAKITKANLVLLAKELYAGIPD